jgi:hypothetical protein
MPQGAHLLLQIRACTLNGELTSTFRNSHPDVCCLADHPSALHRSLTTPLCHAVARQNLQQTATSGVSTTLERRAGPG